MAPLVVFLLFGAIEIPMSMFRGAATQEAASSAARQASILRSAPDADATIIAAALDTAEASLDMDLEMVIVFRADGGRTEPTRACRRGRTTRDCVVYRAPWPPACTTGWCPSERAAGDGIGVQVVVTRWSPQRNHSHRNHASSDVDGRHRAADLGGDVMRRPNTDRGASALELAIILPLLTMLIFAGVETAHTMTSHARVDAAVRSSAVAATHRIAGARSDVELIVAIAGAQSEGVTIDRIVLFDPDANARTQRRCNQGRSRQNVCSVLNPRTIRVFGRTDTDAVPEDTCDHRALRRFCSANVAARPRPALGLRVDVTIDNALGTPFWPSTVTRTIEITVPIRQADS